MVSTAATKATTSVNADSVAGISASTSRVSANSNKKSSGPPTSTNISSDTQNCPDNTNAAAGGAASVVGISASISARIASNRNKPPRNLNEDIAGTTAGATATGAAASNYTRTSAGSSVKKRPQENLTNATTTADAVPPDTAATTPTVVSPSQYQFHVISPCHVHNTGTNKPWPQYHPHHQFPVLSGPLLLSTTSDYHTFAHHHTPNCNCCKMEMARLNNNHQENGIGDTDGATSIDQGDYDTKYNACSNRVATTMTLCRGKLEQQTRRFATLAEAMHYYSWLLAVAAGPAPAIPVAASVTASVAASETATIASKKRKTAPATTIVAATLPQSRVVAQPSRTRACKTTSPYASSATRAAKKIPQKSPTSAAHVHVHVPTAAELHLAVEERKKDMFDNLFEQRIATLRLFQEEHGDADVPNRNSASQMGVYKNDKGQVIHLSKYEGLGAWVSVMRTQLKVYAASRPQSKLTASQAAQLKAIPFCMESKRNQYFKVVWKDKQYQNLLAFYKEHGHLNATTTNKKGVSAQERTLSGWMNMVRKAYDQQQHPQQQKFNTTPMATLTDEQIALLKEINFDFTLPMKTRTFDEHVERWLAYKAQNPVDEHKGVKDKTLSHWIGRVRRQYNLQQNDAADGGNSATTTSSGLGTPLSEEQIERLTSYGFVWTSAFKHQPSLLPRRTFDEHLQDLIAYKEKYGDCKVPQIMPGLGNWVASQRRENNEKLKGKKSRMTEEKKQRLLAVGFSFGKQSIGPRFLKTSSDSKCQALTTKRLVVQRKDLRMAQQEEQQQPQQSNVTDDTMNDASAAAEPLGEHNNNSDEASSASSEDPLASFDPSAETETLEWHTAIGKSGFI